MKSTFTAILLFWATFVFSQSACLFDTNKINVDIWTIDRYNNLQFQNLDTSQKNVEIFLPDEKISFSNTNLGFLASPSLSNIFIERQPVLFQDFFFFTNYQNNLFSSENFIYYKTDKPITDVLYSTTSKAVEENFIDLLHTQNLSENTNIGLRYRMITSKEPVTEQNIGQNNFTMWYQHNKKRHNIHTNFYSNRIKNIENGGVIDTAKEFVRDPISYYLSDVRSKTVNTGLYVNQEYKLGAKKTIIKADTVSEVLFVPRFAVGHILDIKGFNRKYYESSSNADFYENVFLNDAKTYDSVHYAQTLNTFHIKTLTPKFLGIKAKNRVAISSELNNFYYFKDYIFANKAKYEHNTFITASVSKFQIKKFESNFYLKYYIQGTKIGDLDFNTTFKQKFSSKPESAELILQGNYLRSRAGYFIQNYNGNHDQWSNNFKRQDNISADLFFSLPKYNFKINANLNLLNNYIYFDSLAMPQQSIAPINVASISLSKSFKLGSFNTDTKIAYQYNTANKILNLPELVAFNSSYFDFYLFKRALKMNLGLNTYYTTEYNSYRYQPSTGVFYIDENVKTGNYPVVNVFMNVKLKTTLIFLKVEHANAQLLQDYYFTTNHYHTREYFVRFGIRWWFRT